MLQQTRVAAVVPHFERFLERFPNVRALARAGEDEVLRHWAGLGYYHRARNLHRAAKEIVRRHRGRFPKDYAAALALPGIGRYTAAAVLSIAYEQPYAVLDSNVVRVLSRLACLRGDLHSVSYRRKLQALADELLPQTAPGDFNQAMMELGATICLPHRPLCPQCPVECFCAARRRGVETELPEKPRKPARVPVELVVALAERDGRVLVVRDRQRFFAGLWQFPSMECKAGSSHAASLRDILRAWRHDGVRAKKLGEVEHTVTHHELRLHVFLVHLDGRIRTALRQACWVRRDELERLPISSATRKIFRLWQGISGKPS